MSKLEMPLLGREHWPAGATQRYGPNQCHDA